MLSSSPSSRLLLRKLRQLGLEDTAACPMLHLFCEHFKAWRSVLAKYLCVDIQEAKKELIRIFYGGNPRLNIPWLRKLGHEVQAAANLILQDHRYAHLSELYTDRKHPEFSRLCSLLSFDEAELLDSIRMHPNVTMQVALFDGGIVSTSSLSDDIHLYLACESASQAIIPIEVKYDGLPDRGFLYKMIFSNQVHLTAAADDIISEHCLLHAVR